VSKITNSSNPASPSLPILMAELLDKSFVRYKGCLIELPGYKVKGISHDSLQAAQACIDDKFSSLAKSIAA
jgi:hypothetical protein